MSHVYHTKEKAPAHEPFSLKLTEGRIKKGSLVKTENGYFVIKSIHSVELKAGYALVTGKGLPKT